VTTGNQSSPDMAELALRLGNIFVPHHQQQLVDHFRGQTHARFVHYTSADAALQIIESKRLWMRNTNCMADYREVQHGFDILSRFFSDTAKQKAFTDVLDACTPGAAQEAFQIFGKWSNDIRFNTYIAAISEHDDAEDSFGRLSMWRAFGGSVGRVGIVMSVPLATMATTPLGILFNPVAYLSEKEAHYVLTDVIANVNAERTYLQSVDHKHIVSAVFAMLLAGVVCLKHAGFREEREWRVIYSPERAPSPLIDSATEVIRGIPQIIHKLPLDASVSESIADLDLVRLFDRLIIGPSAYPWPMYQAFVGALKNAGIADADKRVVCSDIPIRQT